MSSLILGAPLSEPLSWLVYNDTPMALTEG
jgi:hypothetical protein